MRSERPPVTLRFGRAALDVLLLVVAILAGTVIVAAPAEALPDIRIGYGLNEGAGASVGDASSNNTAATATSPNWTAAGRFGNAVVFDGSSTRVRSNTDVALGAAFTLEAWVFNPGNQDYETIATVGSGRDLYLSSGTLYFYTPSANLVFGAIPTNAWEHVALVSDGSSVRAYLEGTQLGTTQNEAMSATTGPLQIGAWTDGTNNGDFFSGTLDEVRLYNRALTAAQVATDRTTPVSSDGEGGGGGDTTPPLVSAGSPNGTLAAGTTQTTLQVTTSEPANCRYSTTAGTTYAAMTNTFSTTGGTTHSTTFTGLTNGSNYTVFVRCQDSAGNASTSDYTITFSVAASGGGGGGSGLSSWTSTTSLPSPRSGNGAVAANGYLYLIGGTDQWNTVTSTVFVARTNANGTVGTWSTTTPVPVPIRSIRPVFANGFIYLTGGTSDGGTLFATVYYAPVRSDGTLGAWATTTALPQAQISHTAFALNGFVYVVGGNNGTTCVTTVRYAAINANGTLGAWTTTSALPEGRCGVVSAGATYNGYLYLAAGFNNNNVTGRVYYARINANGSLSAWQSSTSTMATSRVYLSAEAVGGRLYVMGGQGDPGNVFSSVEQATINADGSIGPFSAAPSLPGPRGYQAGAQSNGTVYVLGGGTAAGGVTAQSNVWYAQASGGGGGGDTTPPVLSNGSPTGTLAAGTTQATLQVTTNEAATCRYSTTANTAYSAMTNTFSTTGGTTHSTTVTGLQSQAYTFFVRCIDGAGNADTADYSITFTVGGGSGGDTTAPTVSLTAPAGGATVSGSSVAVSATAGDNVGVTGVQFLLDGAALGAEDTTSPYSVTWNTTTASNATHTLTARARDAAGNQTTSATVTVTVSNSAGQPSGLRLGYAFNEGSGTTVADSSPIGNPGTATSTTWTTSGRYGNAITFNGTSSRVRSNFNVTLNSSFTLEAWVLNPTNQAGESIVTVGSDRDLYIENGTLRFFMGSNDLAFGTVSTNTWHHVAIVSDGSAVRAYVDGTQSGSTQNVALGSFSGPVQVGAWTDGTSNSSYYSGTIDEVRVYNARALTAAEIATDRTTPL